MVFSGRIASILGILALVGGAVAVYLPVAQVSSQIDNALQKEEDVVADSLKQRLLSDAEADAEALAGATKSRTLAEIEHGYGESMREALNLNALVLLDAKGREQAFFGSLDTPSGLGRTDAARRIAREAAAAEAGTQRYRGFVFAYGQVYTAAAARISVVVEPSAAAKPVVAVTFTRVEHSVLNRLSQDYRLRGLDLSQERVPGKNALPLADLRGGIVSYLVWSQSSPTETMLNSIGPWVIAVVAAVFLILTILALLALRAHLQAAAALLETAVVVKSDRAKSMLFANLSHEFRTPLNAVIGFSDVMRLRMFGSLGHAKYGEYAEDIHASASHLLALIEDVLTLSRYEADEETALGEPVALVAAAEDVRRMLAQAADAKSLVLKVELVGEPIVAGSDKAIRQIIANLAGNAIKYTERGTVRISAGPARDGAHVELAVEDSGVGIPREHLDRVLRPFEQVDDVYARRQGGTGLGLSIVSAIVKRAGGSIRIESELGVGTRVTVMLRRTTASVQSIEQAKAA